MKKYKYFLPIIGLIMYFKDFMALKKTDMDKLSDREDTILLIYTIVIQSIYLTCIRFFII
jgi:hypothetical protein